MTKTEVITLLEANKNERGIQNWNEMEFEKSQHKSFGIGLTVLRKLAKKIGKDHELAKSLWDSDIYDVKVISVLIDDPKLITKDQMDEQSNNIDFGYLVHVYSACGAPVAMTPFIADVTGDWISSNDSVKRRCGYGFLYELSKSKKKSAPDEAFFQTYIKHIDETFQTEDKSVHMSMGAALLGIGKRSASLHKTALNVAKNIGAIPVETGKTKCEPFDVVKNLNSDYVKKKLGL